MDLTKYDTIIPHIEAYPILEKIKKKSKVFLNKIVWPRKPFGLEGNYFDKKKENKHDSGEALECICKGKKIKKILKENVPKNSNKANEYQVAFPEAYSGGKGKRYKVLPRAEQFFILKKNQISTETYSIANSFDTLREAENFLNFLQTYFSRFLLGIGKPTHHTSAKTFAWVPLMDTKVAWTDEMLFKYFEISKEERKYIKEKVEYWTA